ncbi:DMT family transporter [Actinomycetospora straminea]|uniref:DMT family transporter n=1 Tax=Actinomycetospora straminea TaxID=663607 RepID=A0ABP9F999_9PSEU|nr:DMT family transporter [Actinomycetospora straminea]MDD7936234.1 DMT family transporter [Actinomycetospora straminea]
MAVVLVLLATIANATALVLQRKAAQDSARSRGISAGTLRDMVQRPAWLVGTAIFAVAVALQATALSIGSIALVQPVLVMELPFTLLLGWLVLGGALRRREWIAVAIMSIGLVVLLVTLQPSGGDALGAGTLVWILGTLVTLGLLGLTSSIAKRSRPVGRAAWYGIAAGIGSGFVAVIVKAMSEALIRDGGVGVLTTWQSYLLIPVAPAAFLVLQHALRAGRLLASQPGLILGNPLLSSIWGIGLLGEEINGGAALLGGLAGAALMVVGVFLLSRSPLLAAQEGGPRDTSGSARNATGARRRPL